MDLEEMRSTALQMIKTAVDASDPEKLVQENIDVEEDQIKIGDTYFQKSEFEEIVVLGIGKASVPMVSGCEKMNPDDGLVITKKGAGYEGLKNPIEIREAAHPYPDTDSLKASREMISKVEEKDDALFIFLISGGGSSLFTYPVDEVTIEELEGLNRLLIDSGADIHEINTVRKHLSRVKGGHFAGLCREHGKLVSLILSDVVGDDLSVIASGPTYHDNSTFKDAQDILKEYGIWKKVSNGIRKHIIDGVDRKIKDTPTEVNADNFLVGNNMLALREMKSIAEQNDFNTTILTSQNTGEAKEVAKPFVGIAKDIQDHSTPFEPPAALVIGGETTVDISDLDRAPEGGPNREFVLSAAIEISDRENIVIASVDSDGTDGRGKAGAIADTRSIRRCGLQAKELLRKHESQRFFEELGDSIEMESDTNINDITVILIDEV
ncbi:MAG: DUF4147 domain-containing protein [Candidatus Saliniplasma sp.]